jgi:GMP synthase-like glutamine amidotransferase
MRAHIFQHIPFEGPGNIEPWLKNAAYEISFTRFYESQELPGINDVDFLVIMGGSISVNDESKHSWLIKEKQFIRDFISAGKPVLGICLGSQLIASAMGARVYPNHNKEIGWFPVRGLVSPAPPIFRFPESFLAFHWHGETFDLPPGAVQLARSEACENQAFQIGRSVIGLQFHLETTPGSLSDMISRSGAELVFAKYIQSESEILSASEGDYLSLNELMGKVLGFLIST